MSTRITLTLPELAIAAHAGCARRIINMKRGTEGKGCHNQDKDIVWFADIEGAAGEMAVAKYLQRYWPGVGKVRDYDVGRIQVRTTRHANGHLLLHKESKDGRADNPDDTFVLLRGLAPEFELVGWIIARDGMLDKYWGDKANKNRPCYWVPAEVLHPMSTLAPSS